MPGSCGHPGGGPSAAWVDLAVLSDALTLLSPAQCRAVVLAYLVGYSHTDIAELTGQPPGTVKSQVREGLHRLRTALPDTRSASS
jgi:RNA polymerase sigma-70 factor (ECF subfamily)